MSVTISLACIKVCSLKAPLISAKNKHPGNNIPLLSVLDSLKIEHDDFADMLLWLVESAPFEKIINASKAKVLSEHKTVVHPGFYKHMLVNLMMNAEINRAGHDYIVTEFLENNDHQNEINIPDVSIIHC